MYQVRAKITFTRSDTGFQEFKVFNMVNIHKTYEQLTNKCTVIFPRKYQDQFKDYFGGLDPLFKRGDEIKVEVGYFPNLTTVFEGYIREVNANIPVEVICEDSMYLLKKYTFNIPDVVPLITTSKKGKFLKRPKIDTTKVKKLQLNELLNQIIPDDIELSADIIDIDLGKVIFSRMTASEILQKIKDTHGLFSYFVDKKLYVGFQSNALSTTEHRFIMERQVINANDLYYKRAEDVPLKVTTISIDNNNVKTTYEAGEEDGEERTYHYYNVGQDALKQYAEEKLRELSYTGFHGTMLTFLEPLVSHGERVNITSNKLPEMNGVYLVKSVTINLSVNNGAKQQIELGQKVG